MTNTANQGWPSLVAQLVKNLPAQSLGSIPGKIPWRKTWKPTPLFLPEESPWTEEPGTLQSMGSQRVGHYWIDTMDCSVPGSSVHGDSPGKNTGVGCHALLQGIFPTQGLNSLHWKVGSLPRTPAGKPKKAGKSILFSYQVNLQVTRLTIFARKKVWL